MKNKVSKKCSFIVYDKRDLRKVSIRFICEQVLVVCKGFSTPEPRFLCCICSVLEKGRRTSI